MEVIGLGASLGVDVHVARDTLIEVEGMASGAFLLEPTFLTSASFGVRQFLSGSFYLRGGLRIRELVRPSLFKVADDDLDAFEVVRDLGPDLSIGNRWQWGNFTLGADWLGAYVPATHTAAKEKFVRKSTKEVVASTEIAAGEVRSPIEIRLLHVQAGVTF